MANAKPSVYKIEKGIPIPPRRHPKVSNRGAVDILRKLKIGESVLFPQYSSVASVGGHITLIKEFKFTGRVLPEGVRVWRIE